MGQIYSACFLVHAWLGTPSPDLALKINPFAIFEHAADGKHWHDLPDILEEGDDEGAPSHAFVDQMAGFRLITGSPWWTRSWTVQEIILPESAIMWYGSHSMTWDRIVLAIENQEDSYVHCCTQGTEMKGHWLKMRPFSEFMSSIEMIYQLRQNRHEMNGSPSFHNILLSFSSRQCKDPRDKVFSVFGLAPPHMFRAYIPDYQQSLAVCFTDVYRIMLECDLDVSHVLLGRGFGPYNKGMPSWARDLSKQHDDPTWGQTRARTSDLYNCSAGLYSAVSVSNNNELHVKARRADAIRFVGKPHKNRKLGAESGITFIQQSYLLALEASSYTDEALLGKAFMRTICATLTQDVEDGGQWERCEDDDLPSAETWLSFLAGKTYSFPYSFTSAMLLATENRCLYITEAGNLGMCYPGTKPGDEVWALLGMRVPFVLRRAGGEYQHPDTYHLIGDCFLLDQMDGEIMRNDEETKSIVLV